MESPSRDAGTPKIAARDLHMGFGGVVVLDGISLQVARNEAVGIVGPNGAGKTTLLNILAGAYRPFSGTVTFDGEDVTVLDAANRCRLGIARSHQVPRPFSAMSVFENLFVAATAGGRLDRAAAYRSCAEILEQTGLMRIANRAAGSLGLLDRKRLELARALATAPSVILLDEIAGGLTDEEVVQLVETVGDLHRAGMTIIWIEHIVHALVQVVGRLVCLDTGRIIADDVPSAVMSDAAVIRAYLGGAKA